MRRYSYNEDWERKKSYLIRSLFHDVPNLSPVPEESNDSSDVPPRPPSPIAYRPHSPLPPLIIEREPNHHDEPEEYYEKLAVKIRRIYHKMFIENQDISDSDLLDDDHSKVEIDISHDTNVNNSSVDVSISGYSADYETYDSEVSLSKLAHRAKNNDNNIERDESNDLPTDGNIDTHEDNDSETRKDRTDGEIYEEICEKERETIDLTGEDEPAEEVGSDSTENKSGPVYRQITSQAQIHVDGIQVETQSSIYEGSVRSVILTSQRLRRVEAGQEQESERSGEGSEATMVDKETVILEENEGSLFLGPEDVDMTHNELVEDTEAEVSHAIGDIEVMRTPQPKISVDSIARVAHRPSDVSTEFDVMHHASLMTSETDASNISPDLNVYDDSGAVARGRRRKLRETIFDTEVLGRVSPILNVISSNIKDMGEEFTSDMDMTSPVSRFNVSFPKTMGFVDSVRESGHLNDITSETHVTPPHVNVDSINEEDKENSNDRKRKSTQITSDTEILRREPSLNENLIMDVSSDRGGMTDTLNLNEDRGRKRRAEDVAVQTVSQRVGWEDLKRNFFIGTPKIYKLCNCRDHTCT